MYKFYFTDEDAKKIEEVTYDFEKTNKLFKEIDKKYKFNVPEVKPTDVTLKLEKLNFDHLTDEEIKAKAENALANLKQTTLSGLEDKYNSDKNMLEQEIASKEGRNQEQKQSLEFAYDIAKTNASNDATKRGLARSSIIVNKLEAFDKDMLSNFAEIDKEHAKTMNALESQKSMLETQKQKALTDFNISYATKLVSKIDDLNAQILKEEEKVVKYNNNIAEAEAKFDRENENINISRGRQNIKDKMDFYDFQEEWGNKIESEKQNEKYKIAYNELLKLGPEEAFKEVEQNSAYNTELGENAYLTLYNNIAKRLSDFRENLKKNKK